jgi:photosynthetic reaction center H subunit
MGTGAITGYIDVAQLALYAFWIFFAGLIFYMQREGRREGFPKVNMAGEKIPLSSLYAPPVKEYKLADGRVMQVPDANRDDNRPVKAKPYELGEGSPLVPTGNPMLDGVGPGAWAERADIADVTYEGKPRIVPMRVAKDFHLTEGDFDMVGATVLGADGQVGGKVRDIWVDRSEYLIRYIELDVAVKGGTQTPGGSTPVITVPKRVLVPIAFADIQRSRGVIVVDAILGHQFADVPSTKNPDTVTLLEEERVAGYYGGGLLYATPARQESLV